MNPKLKQLIIVLYFAIICFLAGRGFQKVVHGYTFDVSAKKEHTIPLGIVQWSYVHEYFGVEFLEPGTTIIEFNDRILYKAKCGFQENHPFADKLEAHGNTLDWQDGEYLFHLTIEKMEEKKTEPNQSPEPMPMAVTPPAAQASRQP